MKIEFSQLEVFCKVIERGSFSRAARAMKLSQATISERIAALEQRVGAQLVDRSRRGQVRPTQLGSALLARAERMLSERDLAVQELRDMQGLRRGTVVVGGSNVPATYHLPQVIKVFGSRYPGATVSVSIAGSEKVIRAVSKGTLEFGIVGDPGEHLFRPLVQGQRRTLRARAKLWDDELVLVVPAAHPWKDRTSVTLKDVTDLPFILREPDSGTRASLDAFLRQETGEGIEQLRIVAELGSISAVKQAILSGVGGSILSACSVRHELDAGLVAVIPFAGNPLSRGFYLVCDEERPMSPLGRMFMQVLLEECGASEPSVDFG